MAAISAVRRLRSQALMEPALARSTHTDVASAKHTALCHVLGWLPPQDVCRAAAVSKAWRRAAQDAQTWLAIFAATYEVDVASLCHCLEDHLHVHDWKHIWRVSQGSTTLRALEQDSIRHIVAIVEEWSFTLKIAQQLLSHRAVIPRHTRVVQAPLAELAYWSSRFQKLHELVEQCQQEDIISIVAAAEGVNASVGRMFREEVLRLSRLATEAMWNSKYLSILHAPFEKLAEGQLRHIRIVVAPLPKTLHMVWTSSRFYNTIYRIQPLLQRVTSAIAIAVAEHVDLLAELGLASEDSDECGAAVSAADAILVGWRDAIVGMCGSAGIQYVSNYQREDCLKALRYRPKTTPLSPTRPSTASGGRPGTSSGRPGTSSGRPGTSSGRPVSSPGRPGTSSGRPGTSSGRPGTSSGRPPTADGRPGTASGPRESWESLDLPLIFGLLDYVRERLEDFNVLTSQIRFVISVAASAEGDSEEARSRLMELLMTLSNPGPVEGVRPEIGAAHWCFDPNNNATWTRLRDDAVQELEEIEMACHNRGDDDADDM